MKLRELDIGMSLHSIQGMQAASYVADTEGNAEDSRDKAEEVGAAFANTVAA